MVFDLRNVRQDIPDIGKVIVYWLGGAGHVFKFSDGQVICVDPYLSDYCERVSDGEFRRLCPTPIKANELVFDLLLLSHDHGDHMDVDGFDEYMKTNPGCRILVAKCCAEFLDAKKAKYEVVCPGAISTAGDIVIETVDADHGDICPEAVGFVIKFSGRSIYLTGDTSYNEPLLEKVVKSKPQIIIPCINGAYGNLNEKEAAVLAGRCGCELAIPTHFGLFVQHGGCPRRFGEYLQIESPETKFLAITPGRGIAI